MKPTRYEAIYRTLLERFGEPLTTSLHENATCEQCGMMTNEIDQAHACGINEAESTGVTSVSVERAWEDLFLASGSVTVDQLAAKLGASAESVSGALRKTSWLVVNRDGQVIERGMTPKPFAAVKPNGSV